MVEPIRNTPNTQKSTESSKNKTSESSLQAEAHRVPRPKAQKALGTTYEYSVQTDSQRSLSPRIKREGVKNQANKITFLAKKIPSNAASRSKLKITSQISDKASYELLKKALT